MTELLEFLVKALVEDPEAVVVEELEEDGDLSTRSPSPRATSAG